MLVNSIVKDFLRYHSESSSPATMRFYQQGLAWFVRAFGESQWEELERLAVKDALFESWHKPNGDPYANATQRRNKVAIGQLQRYAVEQEFIPADLLTAKDLAKPGAGQREKIPTAEQLEQIIAAASPAAALAFRGLRACGMRPGELCRADAEMIETNLEGVRALILREHKTARKTGKPRIIAIGEELGRVIAEALANRSAGPIWIDEESQRWTSSRLGDRWRRIVVKLGLPRGMPLYSVRHFVGTWATKRVGIHKAATLLGHTSINMTQRYAHGDESDQLVAQQALANDKDAENGQA